MGFCVPQMLKGIVAKNSYGPDFCHGKVVCVYKF